MKIISNKKWEELKVLEIINIILESQLLQDAYEIKGLEKNLDLAYKEIIDLKKNVRKVCNSKVESVSDKDTKKENKEIKNTTKKVVDNTNEEIAKKLQSALRGETSKLKAEPKKRGRKPKNEQ